MSQIHPLSAPPWKLTDTVAKTPSVNHVAAMLTLWSGEYTAVQIKQETEETEGISVSMTGWLLCLLPCPLIAPFPALGSLRFFIHHVTQQLSQQAVTELGPPDSSQY